MRIPTDRLVTAVAATMPHKAKGLRPGAGGLEEEDASRRSPARAVALPGPGTPRIVNLARSSRTAAGAGVADTLVASRNIVTVGSRD